MAEPVRILIVCGGSGVALLGQRPVLGMSGEIYIDVSAEIEQTARLHSTDPRSYAVELDRRIGTTGGLFDQMDPYVQAETPEGVEEAEKPILSYLHTSIVGKAARRHFDFLRQYSQAGSALQYGLAQSPAIGGLAIRHPLNRRALERALREILTNLPHGLGPENPLEVWIVSSTAGGTGEGTHRFVGAFVARHVALRHRTTPVTINFIRIGQMTYRSVNERRTALNSFFGVAADAAFALALKDKYPYMVTQWFYVDLPDVGTGERSIKVRAQLVEMAAKAIMVEELRDDLARLLVNNQGMPMITARTGYWGRDFGEQRLYAEVLSQLRRKLKDLLQPDYRREYIEKALTEEALPPRFEAREDPRNYLEEWKEIVRDADLIRDMGWQLPRASVGRYPQSLAEVQDLVAMWREAMGRLVDEPWDMALGSWQVQRVRRDERGEEVKEPMPLDVNTADVGDFGKVRWFERVREAHEARAWARHLLGCDLRNGKPRRGSRENPTLIDRLLMLAEEIGRAQGGWNPFKSKTTRAREVAEKLPEFLQVLAEVDALLRVEAGASEFLGNQLKNVNEVMVVVKREHEIVRQAVGMSGYRVILAADLDDELDRVRRETWLEMLLRAVRRGDPEEFRRVVVRGATGLTEAGLRDVLGLSVRMAPEDMHDEMLQRVGRMYDADGREYEAQWWQATPPVPTLTYAYRILPWLDRRLQAKFEALAPQGQRGQFRYIFTKMGATGLYVLAFEGHSLNERPGDFVSTPAYLLSPFVPQLREALAERRARVVVGRESGQMRITTAGVIGEPLFVPALRAAGLTDKELAILGEYYELWDPDQEELQNIQELLKQKSEQQVPSQS